jgi:DNA repair protein RecO (recombination protein O)
VTLYREHGIVLRTYKLGEADRIVVFITRGRGKVRSVAKGVRKTRSKFGARLEPTSHASLKFYEGRDLDIVTQAESIDQFRSIRDDYNRFARASAMLEAVDQIAQEHEVTPGLYNLLLGALRAIDQRDAPLVVAGFFMKLLAQEGFRPQLDECVQCGAHDDIVAIDIEHGGVLCRSCRQGRALSPEALRLLRLILGGRLGEALAEPASAGTREVDQVATDALEHHLERRLRSVSVIDR